MSDGISISEGGYTAVSSDSLRDAANRAVAVASLLRETVTSATRAGDCLSRMTIMLSVADEVAQIGALAATLAQLIDVFAMNLLRAADVYEAAELLIAAHLNDATPAQQRRLAELEARRPGVVEQALGLAMSAGGFKNYASLGALKRTGKSVTIVERTTRHTTNVKAVVPAGAADLAKTIPTGDAQIRVDRYNMPDGSQRFVVSVSGTRPLAPPAREPFDMYSNIDLYLGNDSTSAEAVRRALEDAGVEPGDWLMLNTHSQAAMIADRLAPDPNIDPEMVVTWGNPGEQPMPSDVVNIDIKHTNDPVGWLGGAEYPIPTGAEASFEVSRDTNAGRPGATVTDAATAHFLDAYIETGTLMDASQDPRMDGLRDPLAELAEAESVTTTEYVFEDATDEPGMSFAEPLARSWNGQVGPRPQAGGDPMFEFSDPVGPHRWDIAPPPEPGQPTFQFAPLPENDNHVGPWRL